MRRLHTQIHRHIFIALFLLVSAFTYYSYRQDIDSRENLESSRDQHLVELNNAAITGELRAMASELSFIAGLFSSNTSKNDLSAFSQLLLSVAGPRGFYYQLRFIDASGKERLCINNSNGEPVIAPATAGRNSIDGNFLRTASSLDKGRVILRSFFPENDENNNGQRSLLQIATSVSKVNGDHPGVIVLDYPANTLLTASATTNSDHGRRLMLFDGGGRRLTGTGQINNRQPDTSGANQVLFGNHGSPLWEKFSGLREGSSITEDGVYSWRSLFPWQNDKTIMLYDDNYKREQKAGQAWKLVLLREAGFIDSLQAPVKHFYLAFLGLMGFLFAVASVPLTYLRVKQKTDIDNKKMLQEAQLFTNNMLQSALTDKTLEQLMHESLEMILSISWLSVLAKGSIFLPDNETNELVMVAQKDLSEALLTTCARLPLGRCLCGKAGERKEIIFTSCLDHQHEITFDGITEHGHICVPILEENKLLGVLNLYVEHGHRYNHLQEETLKVIVTALASIIERKQLDDHLQQVHEEVRLNRDKLAYERGIIEDTLSRIRSADEFDASDMRYLMAPVESTAADILLSAFRPDGIRYIMLGDFTGHGLSSALAGPTVADTFYAMTKRGLSAVSIITEINSKLAEKLPANIFLAACFIEFNPETNSVVLWNASLPELVLFRAGMPVERFKSELLALGIVEDLPLDKAERVIDLKPGDYLYAYTDGALEAYDANGEMFGQQRFENLLSSIITQDKALETVIEELENYQTGYSRADDFTMLEIRAQNLPTGMAAPISFL